MMELADFAMYVAVFSAVGPQPLAVTTNLNINFLRKPSKADLIADARLLKVGKRLAVGEVAIYSEGSGDPVAHVTSTYSIPANALISYGTKIPFLYSIEYITINSTLVVDRDRAARLETAPSARSSAPKFSREKSS